MVDTVLGGLSIIVGVVAYIPYIGSIFTGVTKPHAFSWLVWGSATAVAFAGQLAAGAGPGAWISGYTVLACGCVFVLALQRGDRHFPAVDWFCLSGVLAAALLWVVTNSPLTAIVALTVADTVAFGLTIKKSWRSPNTEAASIYPLGALKLVVALAALHRVSVATVLFSASGVVQNMATWVVLIYRRQVLRDGLRLAPRAGGCLKLARPDGRQATLAPVIAHAEAAEPLSASSMHFVGPDDRPEGASRP